MDLNVHVNEPDLRDLAGRLVNAAGGGGDGDEDVEMLLQAHTDAVQQRREELRERLQRLDLDESIVQVDAADAMDVDVQASMHDALQQEGMSFEDGVNLTRRIARESPDGSTRAEARRWLQERGLPLDDDGSGGQ